MKKSLIVAALALLSASAFAETSFSYLDGVQKNEVGNATTHVNLVIVKTDLTKNFAVDYLATLKSDSSNTISNRQEGGLTYTQSVAGPVSAYARGSLGLKQTSGTPSFSYFTVEPGVAIALGDKLQAKVGYYYRDETQSGHLDYLRQARYYVSYSLTPKDKILAAYMHDLKGNVTLANTPYIGYSRSF